MDNTKMSVYTILIQQKIIYVHEQDAFLVLIPRTVITYYHYLLKGIPILLSDCNSCSRFWSSGILKADWIYDLL